MSHENTVDVFSKDTFLTALRNGSSQNTDVGATDGAKQVVEEPAAMALVREKHAQLHEVVGSLSEKISAVLGRQEKDFLAAYRAHMYNVQKELHELREKMHRNETVENKTEKIKKIEEERDWYRKEALRLDAFTTSMTKDLKYMREKLESIEEDRNWLEKQLKACKKQNKLLRAELDVRITSGAGSAMFDINQLPAFESPKAVGVGKYSSSKRALEDSEVVEDRPNLPSLSSVPASISLVDEREEKFRRQVRRLKKELQDKNQEVAMLRRQRVDLAGSEARSCLENFFLQCVESVKEEVTRRRNNPDTKKEKMNALRTTSLADKRRNQKQNVGAEFEDFSAADRVRVVERLLAHDDVLTLLYTHLFPSEARTTFEDAQRLATSEDMSCRADHTIRSSLSSKSLPDQSSPNSLSTRKVNFEPTQQPVGSGAAVASAVRGGLLPIDDSTRDYLRSMKLGTST